MKFVKARREASIARSEINVESLCQLTRQKYTEFIVKNFNLYYRPNDGAVTLSPTKGKKLIESDDDIATYIDSTDNGADLTFYIENNCKGFSEFTIPDALRYAGALGDEPILDDEKFNLSDFKKEDELVKKILEHAVADIMCKLPIFGPIESAQNEASVRELIGPVLVAAARISMNIRIVSEKQITGSMGNGPVDYDMIYKDFNIVITEAKKEDMKKGLGQNIAQLVGGREDYLVRKETFIPNKKRSLPVSEYQPLIADIPSCGIVSTANTWVFLRYSRAGTHPVVYRSNAFEIPLGHSTTEGKVMDAMTIVVRILVEILRTQKLAVDSNTFVLSQKSEEKRKKNVQG